MSSASVALFRELPLPYVVLAVLTLSVVIIITVIVVCAILPEAWRELRAARRQAPRRPHGR